MTFQTEVVNPATIYGPPSREAFNFNRAIAEHRTAVEENRIARQVTLNESDACFWSSHVLIWARVARTWLEALKRNGGAS